MKCFLSVVSLAMLASLAVAVPASAKDHRHHYMKNGYVVTCVNEEKTCGNWNIGKPN